MQDTGSMVRNPKSESEKTLRIISEVQKKKQFTVDSPQIRRKKEKGYYVHRC